MSEHKTIVVADVLPVENHSATPYVIGFGLSVYITLMAYLSVVHHLFSRRVLLYVLPATALTQFIVQLFFFMHIGRERKPRWKLFVLCFMILIVTILVAGSIWIMANLDYHGRSQAEVNRYLQVQDRL